MLANKDHASFVDGWVAARLGGGFPAARLLSVFERAVAALWRQSELTLGEITLRAIVNRVLRSGRESYPLLERLRIETTGVSFRDLRSGLDGLTEWDLASALGFLIVEFLAVLGSLTGEILTPELHAALAEVASRPAAEDENQHGDEEGKRAS